MLSRLAGAGRPGLGCGRRSDARPGSPGGGTGGWSKGTTSSGPNASAYEPWCAGAGGLDPSGRHSSSGGGLVPDELHYDHQSARTTCTCRAPLIEDHGGCDYSPTASTRHRCWTSYGTGHPNQPHVTRHSRSANTDSDEAVSTRPLLVAYQPSADRLPSWENRAATDHVR